MKAVESMIPEEYLQVLVDDAGIVVKDIRHGEHQELGNEGLVRAGSAPFLASSSKLGDEPWRPGVLRDHHRAGQSIEIGILTPRAKRPLTRSGTRESKFPGVATVVVKLGDDVGRGGMNKPRGGNQIVGVPGEGRVIKSPLHRLVELGRVASNRPSENKTQQQ